MKLTKTNHRSSRSHTTGGFTLLEMIGVLAVIAILAAVLIPKVFAAIDNARVNNAAMSCNTVKTAIADHYTKFGALSEAADPADSTKSITLTVPSPNYDTNLVIEGFLDKPFAVRVGTGASSVTNASDAVVSVPTTIWIGTGSTASDTAPTAPGIATGDTGETSFDLDGVGNANDAVGSAVVYAVISGVNLNDARALNTLIDGNSAALGESVSTAGSEKDVAGRVKYDFAESSHSATAGTTTVYVYLTHR